MLRAVPSNDSWLQSHCLAMSLYATLTCLFRLDSSGCRKKGEELPLEFLRQTERYLGSQERLCYVELHKTSPHIKLTSVYNVCLPPVAGHDAVGVCHHAMILQCTQRVNQCGITQCGGCLIVRIMLPNELHILVSHSAAIWQRNLSHVCVLACQCRTIRTEIWETIFVFTVVTVFRIHMSFL
jgi:hypothetical protein